MIDFHNHVIPKIDDGANDLMGTSLNMLNHAAEQGIADCGKYSSLPTHSKNV